MSIRRKTKQQRAAKREERAALRAKLAEAAEQAEAAQPERAEALEETSEPPFAPQMSHGRGRQIVAYAKKVYGMGEVLAGLPDERQSPEIPAPLIHSTLFVGGLLRVRSLNAFEAELEKAWFANAVGAKAPAEDERLFSAETLSRQLVSLGAQGARPVMEEMIHKAERNKVFREGWVGALRYVAIDGWEPICSFHRHCPYCLEREVTVGEGENKREVTQYYHRLVVALLLGEHEEVVIGFESLRNCEQRRLLGESNAECDEGEQTAAIRLVERLRKTYGRWLDVIVADGLYANGPFLTALKSLKFGALIVAKKEKDEPLREAFNLWNGLPPSEVYEDKEAGERVELWDCKELTTLDSFKGPIRVTRALVHSLEERTGKAKPRQWCFISIGVALNRLTARQLFKAIRGRWHIENTGFNQWTQHWPFEHVFVNDWRGMQALFSFLFAAFNLMQLFLYRQVKGYARLKGTDPTKTIISFVAKVREDLVASRAGPLDWSAQPA